MQAKMIVFLFLRNFGTSVVDSVCFGFAGTEAHVGVGGGKEAFLRCFLSSNEREDPLPSLRMLEFPHLGA